MSYELRQKLRTLLEPSIDGLGLELVAVEWMGGPRRGTLRISVDRAGGVSAQDCAMVSRRISPILDVEDPVSGAYQLEVSSPGMERPLQRIEDFERFKGYRARIRLESGLARRRYTGRLLGVSGADVLVSCEGEEMCLPHDSIERAHLLLTLDEYAAIGARQPEQTSSLTEATERRPDHDHQ